MFDQLLYGAIDLADQQSGGVYMATTDTSLGEPQAVTETLQGLFADGSVVVGDFDDNRSVTLVISITSMDRLSLAQAADALGQEVAKATNTLTWVPGDGGFTQVLETYKGQLSLLLRTPIARVYQAVIPAAPFIRSDSRQTVSGANASVQLGDFTQTTEYAYHVPDHTDNTVYAMPNITVGPITVPFPVTGTAYPKQTSPAPIDGSGCMRVDFDWFRWDNGSHSSFQWQTAAKVGPVTGAWDISGCRQIALGVNMVNQGVITAYLTLKDSSNASQTFQASTNGATNAWLFVPFDISAATVNLAAITSWTLIFTDNETALNGTGNSVRSCYLGELRAFPSSSQTVATTRGAVFKLAAVQGSARTVGTLEVDRGGVNTMSGLLVARAPATTPATTPILLPVAGGAASTTAPSTFAGTYRVLVCGTSISSVTLQQKVKGSNVGSPTVLTATQIGSSTIWDCGLVTLPIVGTPADVTALTYSITTQTGATDVMFIDTRASLVFVQSLTTPAKYIWIDEPQPGYQVGGVWAGQSSDRSDAISCIGTADIEGGLTYEPGDNYVLIFCPDAVPTNVTFGYYPRWRTERTA